MKHALRSLSAAAALTACCANAQFDALPDSNATWTETFWIGPGYPYQGFFHAYDHVAPDTLYNGEVYKKVLTTYSYGSVVSEPSYNGALRDNGQGQVYYWASGASEPVLLYDFDVQAGDTVDGVYGLWMQDLRVFSVDLVTVNNTPRKRIGLECLDQPGVLGAYWIQGIGGTGGLFFTTPCPSVSGTGTLVCMTVNDTVQYGTNVGDVGDCSILLSAPASRIGQGEQLSVSPVPAVDRLQLRGISGGWSAEIFAGDGCCVQHMRSQGSSLSVEGLVPGVYVLRLTDASAGTRTTRFVKE